MAREDQRERRRSRIGFRPFCGLANRGLRAGSAHLLGAFPPILEWSRARFDTSKEGKSSPLTRRHVNPTSAARLVLWLPARHPDRSPHQSDRRSSLLTNGCGVYRMDTTSFNLFFLPFLQDFSVCFLVLAACRTLLVSAVRLWNRPFGDERQSWRCCLRSRRGVGRRRSDRKLWKSRSS
jgi:hypothetical protein